MFPFSCFWREKGGRERSIEISQIGKQYKSGGKYGSSLGVPEYPLFLTYSNYFQLLHIIHTYFSQTAFLIDFLMDRYYGLHF